MSNPTAEKQLIARLTGEGFAFFRWHMLRWPDCDGSNGGCQFSDPERFFCVRLWMQYTR